MTAIGYREYTLTCDRPGPAWLAQFGPLHREMSCAALRKVAAKQGWGPAGAATAAGNTTRTSAPPINQPRRADMASLRVRLDDGTQVTLFPDGTADVDLAAMRVARRDLLGRISVYPDGSVQVWRCEDGLVNAPLPVPVVRAAENAARQQAARAKRVAQWISRLHASRSRTTKTGG